MTCAATAKASLCIGCGICRAACPCGAISMRPGRDLVARPVLDKSKCTSCGLCAKFCPNAPDKISVMAERAATTRGSQPIAPPGAEAQCFLAWDAADPAGRKRSASGGVATAIALKLLEEKKIDAVVHAKRILSGRGAAHGAAAVSRSADEVNAGRGSVYEPIDFSDAMLSLKDGERVFMTGTPCVIRGVKALFAEHPRYRNMKLSTCALVCSHNVTPQFADYFADRKHIAKAARYAVDFRDKTDIPDAGNFNSRYVSEDGTNLHLANRNKNGWTRLWRSYAFAVPACCKCPDFWCVEADVSVKDAWGRREWTSDPLGKSVAVVRDATLLAAFRVCGFAGGALDAAEVAKMQKPQLEYKLDAAKEKLARPAIAPANFRNGHFPKALTAWFSRFAYAHLGTFVTRVGLKFILLFAKEGKAVKKRRGGMRTRTILVVGGYGYGNAGDEAQCAETLRLLAERYPRYQIRNLTPAPNFSFGEHPRFAHDYAPRVLLYNAGRRFNWYKLGSLFRKAGFLFASLMALLNARFVKRGWPVWFINARKAMFLQELSQSSMLYFCGGGYLTGATRSRLWEGMVLCRLCKVFGVPVVMSGQTVGVWGGRLDRWLAKWGFRDVKVIGLRDNEDSARDLAEVGVCGDRVMCTHDDALFCEKAPERQVEGRYIAVNFHFWGIAEGDERQSVLARIHDAIDKARKATGVSRVVFVAMHVTDMQSFEAYRSIYQTDNIEAFHCIGQFRDIRRVIADAEMLLTMKHHPIIFAAGEGTPVVSLAYSPYYVHKNFGAMQQYGVEACSTDLAAEDWPSQFDAALAKALDREWFAAETSRHLETLKARKEAFMDKVDALLGRSVQEGQK